MRPRIAVVSANRKVIEQAKAEVTGRYELVVFNNVSELKQRMTAEPGFLASLDLLYMSAFEKLRSIKTPMPTGTLIKCLPATGFSGVHFSRVIHAQDPGLPIIGIAESGDADLAWQPLRPEGVIRAHVGAYPVGEKPIGGIHMGLLADYNKRHVLAAA